MKEIDLQSDTVAAVRAAGGAARKLSHRFVLGVPDLLVKLPGWPAALVEVKKNPYPARSNMVVPELTWQQFRFLTEFETSGMPAAVLSFLIRGLDRWAAVHDISGIQMNEGKDGYCAYVSNYRPLGRGNDWRKNIAPLLDSWLQDLADANRGAKVISVPGVVFQHKEATSGEGR